MLSGVLSGCGSITAETGSSAYVAPGKYDVYTCTDIDRQVQATQKRKAELEQLMGRASEGAGGAIAMRRISAKPRRLGRVEPCLRQQAVLQQQPVVERPRGVLS
jgi:hypothetical protein